MVAPAATLRVVLMPASVQDSAKSATAGMLAGLRLAVSGTDVVSISWDLGEHFFTKAQAAEMNSDTAGSGRSPRHGGRQLRRHRRVQRHPAVWEQRRSRRSAFRPPTRSCWPLAAPRSP